MRLTGKTPLNSGAKKWHWCEISNPLHLVALSQNENGLFLPGILLVFDPFSTLKSIGATQF